MTEIQEYEEIMHSGQGDSQIEYGTISGSNLIFFIKVGMLGNIYGRDRKYLKIARSLNSKHGCTVIVSSNPNGYDTDFQAEMDVVRQYAMSKHLEDYRIYFMGHSNGACLGMINAYKYKEIKRAICINGPLIINPQKLLQGLHGFSGELMYLIYGSRDCSCNIVHLYAELESEKIKLRIVRGADHNFKGLEEDFAELPELLFS